MKLNKYLFVLSTIALVSCGEGGSSGGTGVDPASDNGSCSSETVSDYNTVVLRCKTLHSVESARNCKSSAQSFVDKYSNLNCKARQTSSGSINSTEVTVTTEKIKSLINELSEQGI